MPSTLSPRLRRTAPSCSCRDQNLGAWVGRQLGRPMELWNGACHVHMEFTRDQILALKEKTPGALVVAHPECTEAVRLLADQHLLHGKNDSLLHGEPRLLLHHRD